MENILDKIKSVLNDTSVFLGFLPAEPDNVIALFEYNQPPPIHSFGKTNPVHNVQVRVRNKSASSAYEIIEGISKKLNRYADNEINIVLISGVFDIGKDSHNPQRNEFTANFKVTMIK